MAAPIPLRSDFDAFALRSLARASKNANQARRLLALASIYDGDSRSDAARLGNVTLQIVRDWVSRFNAQGPDGLIDRTAPGASPARLDRDHRGRVRSAQPSGNIAARLRAGVPNPWATGGGNRHCRHRGEACNGIGPIPRRFTAPYGQRTSGRHAAPRSDLVRPDRSGWRDRGRPEAKTIIATRPSAALKRSTSLKANMRKDQCRHQIDSAAPRGVRAWKTDHDAIPFRKPPDRLRCIEPKSEAIIRLTITRKTS